MENTNVKEKTIEQKLYDVACDMGELGYAGTTIHEMANILKRDYFEIIPIKPEDKSAFVNGFYTMNELINVIWDYSERVKQELDSISDRIMEIRKAID
jgi:predicted CoA-binding protein